MWLWSPDRGIRADRLEEWTAELRAMNPKERPAHAGSLLWEGFLRSSSRLPSRIVAVVSRRRSRELPLLNPYDLLRDADIVAIGTDGAELPVQWDPETDSLSFLSGYLDDDTRAWVHHMPPMERGDNVTFLFEIKAGSPPITPHSVRIYSLPGHSLA